MSERRGGSRWPYPFWIAHRGGGRLAPENTLAAFRAGQARGYAIAECDVTLSADGVAFLLHDATLERTTDGRGRAADFAWGQLQALDAGAWFGAGQHRGERLPTLAALLAHARASGLQLNLELKPGEGDARRTGRIVARQVSQWLAGRRPDDPAPPPLLSSFDAVALEAARAEAPDSPRALLFDAVPRNGASRAAALGCIAIGASHRRLDAATIAAAQAAGLAVIAYTVNEPPEAERLRAAGIDALFTDALDVFDPRQ